MSAVKQINDYARQTLKDLLAQCTEPQQMMFKRMYSHKNLELPIDQVADLVPKERLEWAITQCENSVNKNKLKAEANG